MKQILDKWIKWSITSNINVLDYQPLFKKGVDV